MKRREERRIEDSSDTSTSRGRKEQCFANAPHRDNSKDTSTRHTRGKTSEGTVNAQNLVACPQERRQSRDCRKRRKKGKNVKNKPSTARCEEMYCPPLSEEGSGSLASLSHFSAEASTSFSSPNSYRNTRSEERQGRRKSKGRNKARGTTMDPSKSSTSADTTTVTSSNNDPPDIPGMYYDKERKRYFHILPSGSAIAGGITRETIAAKEAEEQRQKDLERLSKPKTDKPASATAARYGINKQCLPFLLSQHHMGSMGSLQLRRTVALNAVEQLQLQGTMAVFEQPQGEQERVEHMLQMDATEDGSQLLALWSVKGTMMQRMQLLTIDHRPGKPQRALSRDADSAAFSSSKSSRTAGSNANSKVSTLPLKVDPRGMTVLQSWNKITKVCWAPFPQFPGKKYVLYTTMCHAGYIYSLAFIRNLDPDARDDVCYFDFNLGKRTTWTCAWDQHHQRFSVGVEKSCIVIDTLSRRLWEYSTHNSDPLTQTFDHTTGHLLYNGVRRGSVLLLDLRTSSRHQPTVASAAKPLSCLTLSKDDLYLYSSDFSGVVRRWDLRMRRAVVDYPGHINQYTRLPLHLSHDETLLYTVGQDCYTSFWDTESGRCLLRLPPPRAANQDFLPSVQFHSHWGGPSGNPGLVMGLQNKLYLYSGFCSPEALET